MRARVTTVTAKPVGKDEIIKAYTEGTVPVAMKQDGVEGALLLVDPSVKTGLHSYVR